MDYTFMVMFTHTQLLQFATCEPPFIGMSTRERAVTRLHSSSQKYSANVTKVANTCMLYMYTLIACGLDK